MNARRNAIRVLSIIAVIVGSAVLLQQKQRLPQRKLIPGELNQPQHSAVSASSPAIKRQALAPNSTPPASTTVAKRFPNCPVLQTRTETLANGDIRRFEVVESNGKYPFIRVETLLRQDPASGAEKVLHVTETVADQVIVDLHEGKQEQDLVNALQTVDGKIVRKLELDYTRSYLVSLPEPTIDAASDAILQLAKLPDVISEADVNGVARKQALPNDPSFSQSWHLRNTGQRGGVPDSDIDAEEAWSVHTGNSSVLVAITDSGVDYNHFDLRENIWRNTGERDDNGSDDDHNGYRDDIRGWDFVDWDNSPLDDDNEGGHGTLVAGIIGARGNNGAGIAGLCWYCQIIPLRVLDSEGLGYNSDIVEGLNYAKRAGAKIINASHGGSGSVSLQQAIADLEAAGVLLIAPAGNEGENIDYYPLYPASYDNGNIISVAATDPSDGLSWFSSYGSESVDVAAPGSNIYSTSHGGSFTSASGTSFATPVVSGLAALLKSKNPAWSHVQVRNQILSTVEQQPGLWSRCATSGRVNAYQAVVGRASFPKALESSGMSWSTGGDLPWWGAEVSTVNGTDWAESGSIWDSEASYLQATVTGPGSVNFWWKVSSEQSYDIFRFEIDGVYKMGISGAVNWSMRTYQLGPGSHTLRWTYAKDGSASSGDDKAWLDGVRFFGTPPKILTQPVGQVVNLGSAVSFSVEANGHAPLQYQWRRNGVDLSGATRSILTLTNTSAADAGNYVVQIRNPYGQTNSRPAVLSICSAALNPNMAKFDNTGGAASVEISTSTNCWWTAVTTNDWISLTSATTGQGNGSLTYSVAPNETDQSRIGAIVVEGTKLIVTQSRRFAPAAFFAHDFLLTITSATGDAEASGSFLLVASNPEATNQFMIVPLQGSIPPRSGTYSYAQSGNSATVELSTESGSTTIEFVFESPSGGSFTSANGEGTQAGVFMTQKSRADFNGDGLNDLLLMNSNRTLTAWCMAGTNFVQTLRLRGGQPLASAWNVAGTGDLLNRGQTDVLLQSTTGQLALWLMQDGTNVADVVQLRDGTPTPPGWKAKGLHDFDGDGHLDVLLQHDDRRAAVWLMNGTEFLRSVQLKRGNAAAAGWRSVAVNDFNDDGEADILWQHQDGRLAVWQMFGLEFLASVPLANTPTPSPGWRVVAMNDIDQDGRNDILLQHPDGRLKVWFMENSEFKGALVLRRGLPMPQGGIVVAPK